jgi:(p)ppGpp synthase/HD superfamily hydrolase
LCYNNQRKEFNMNGHALRELAHSWATVVHDGQSRKGAGEPYIKHAERVADAVWGWRRKAIAYLHDVVEDSDDPAKMKTALYTVFPDDIVDDVMWLSRLPDENGEKMPYQQWIEFMARSANQDVIAVKLADLEDNLHDLKDIPGGQGLEFRYLRAKAELMEVYDES